VVTQTICANTGINNKTTQGINISADMGLKVLPLAITGASGQCTPTNAQFHKLPCFHIVLWDLEHAVGFMLPGHLTSVSCH
jgi:hypothetical protein